MTASWSSSGSWPASPWWLGLHRYCAVGSRGLGLFTLPMAIMMIGAAAMTPLPGATSTT